jgi:hypothetical protein
MAYTDCAAKSTTVAGQTQSTAAMPRPVMTVVVAMAMMNAGRINSPASPETVAKGLEACRRREIRPASTTFQTMTSRVSARCAGASHCFTRTRYLIRAPASCAMALSVVWAAFSPSRKSLSLNVLKTSVG